MRHGYAQRPPRCREVEQGVSSETGAVASQQTVRLQRYNFSIGMESLIKYRKRCAPQGSETQWKNVRLACMEYVLSLCRRRRSHGCGMGGPELAWPGLLPVGERPGRSVYLHRPALRLQCAQRGMAADALGPPEDPPVPRRRRDRGSCNRGWRWRRTGHHPALPRAAQRDWRGPCIFRHLHTARVYTNSLKSEAQRGRQ